tara:strand:+ start:5927 stop:6136 length:210 start_codon:yes stop_codon:yes gene_type:complete
MLRKVYKYYTDIKVLSTLCFYKKDENKKNLSNIDQLKQKKREVINKTTSLLFKVLLAFYFEVFGSLKPS